MELSDDLRKLNGSCLTKFGTFIKKRDKKFLNVLFNKTNKYCKQFGKMYFMIILS